MATMVRETQTGHVYALVGTGFGAFHSKTPNWFLGNLSPDIDHGQYAMVCVCDPSGKIGWMLSDAVEVLSVDGVPVAELWQ